jgi:hypothetical protein
MRKFKSCEFGPFQTRSVLKRVLEPGERPIGWGVVKRDRSLAEILLAAVSQFVPVLGLALAAVLADRLIRFVILTDSRLIVLPRSMDRRTRSIRIAELRNTPLDRLMVDRLGKRAYTVQEPGKPDAEYYLIHWAQSEPGKRLIDGLNLLAAESAAAEEHEIIPAWDADS